MNTVKLTYTSFILGHSFEENTERGKEQRTVSRKPSVENGQQKRKESDSWNDVIELIEMTIYSSSYDLIGIDNELAYFVLPLLFYCFIKTYSAI